MNEQATGRNNWFFRIGVGVLVFTSVVIGVLHIGVLYLFGIPFLGLLVGFALIWLSDAKRTVKILLTFSPIPIIVAAFLLAFQINKAEPETFIVPIDFRGEFVVFLDEPCGRDTVYDNGRRVYEIPGDGVLITKAETNSGYLDQKFYFTDQNGLRVKLPIFNGQNFDTEQKEWSSSPSFTNAELTKDTVGVFWSFGSETYNISQDSIAWIISNYQRFEVPDKERSIIGEQFAKNAETILKRCRQSQ